MHPVKDFIAANGTKKYHMDEFIFKIFNNFCYFTPNKIVWLNDNLNKTTLHFNTVVFSASFIYWTFPNIQNELLPHSFIHLTHTHTHHINESNKN